MSKINVKKLGLLGAAVTLTGIVVAGIVNKCSKDRDEESFEIVPSDDEDYEDEDEDVEVE